MEEPMDKAGAYAVQGYFARYIKGMNGSYANVMGLPVQPGLSGIEIAWLLGTGGGKGA